MMMNGNKIKSCKPFSNFYANYVSILILFQGFVICCTSLDIKVITKSKISKYNLWRLNDTQNCILWFNFLLLQKRCDYFIYKVCLGYRPIPQKGNDHNISLYSMMKSSFIYMERLVNHLFMHVSALLTLSLFVTNYCGICVKQLHQLSIIGSIKCFEDEHMWTFQFTQLQP